MLFSVEQAFVGREEIRAPLKMPAWEAISQRAILIIPYTIGPATPTNEWICSANKLQQKVSLHFYNFTICTSMNTVDND